MLHNIIDAITGGHKKIKGTVVLMKKNVLDFNDFHASVLDRFHELLGQGVSLQLISAVHADPSENGLKGKLGEPAYLEEWITNITSLTAGESAFNVTFDWDEEIGVPGAFLIRNNHHSEFYLKTVTLDGVPGQGSVHFVCNSWVYPTKRYNHDRVFFTNQTYLPHETPAPLRKYREEELVKLRGDGKGELKEWDRVYDYAYYNDLGDPDKGAKYVRPVLGGSSEYPYPRRGRTGRAPTKSDPNTESREPVLMSLNIYVPRDERFGHLKMADFLAYALKSVAQFIKPELQALADSTPNEFDSFDDVLKLYEGGFKLPDGPLLENLKKNIPLEMLKEIIRTDGEGLFRFPKPQVIQANNSAWRTDEEFGREMLSGVNPVIIIIAGNSLPKSKLDRKLYGDQNSTITEEHIKDRLDGLAIDEAIEKNRMFILDHHDALMPYLRRINTTTTKTYATRTLLFLKDDGTLKPIAIELSLPHEEGDEFGAISKVYSPAEHGVEGTIWELAKAYVAQALPEDLKKRGMAVEDPKSAHGVRLLIEDYPYAVDGLEIWSAIKRMVREEGHGDLKDATWWPKMQTREELIDSCTIIIWIASALHAAVNFGQYPYAGYLPNRPTVSRRFMPEEGSAAYEELKSNPDKAFLKTITAQLQTLLGISLIEILSRHSSDEVYLGQRDNHEWTADKKALEAFEKFGKKLAKIEDNMFDMNKDGKWKNRVGPVKVPYTLLVPTSAGGLTGRGIPNSVSI
ncbi:LIPOXYGENASE [Salix purpurea]|uniref:LIPOXYGENASE n=1 Tax=Salix purpurea TaxID=77065 RepID=A0A9Q1AL78_SALPP|nr:LIPOXYGENASE [Salix purpurea]